MKKIKEHLPLIIIAFISVVAIVAVILLTRPKPVESYKEDFAKLNRQLDSLKSDRERLAAETARYREVVEQWQKVDSLIKLNINDNHYILEQIQLGYEKVNYVDTFGSADIQRYFSKEFGQR